MAATLTQDRFTGPEWIFERKFDGIRLLAFKNSASGFVSIYGAEFLRRYFPQGALVTVEAGQTVVANTVAITVKP